MRRAQAPVVALPLVVLSLVASVAGCGPGTSDPTGDCASAAECGATQAACAGCPELPEALCVEASCVERASDAVNVSVDVNLHRDVAASVQSFVHVLVAAVSASGLVSCESALEGGHLAEETNVLAAGFKSVEGGSFHEDVSVGRAPEGDLLLVVMATSENAGQGAVLATGCLEGLSAAAPSLDAGLVQVAP